MSKGPDVRRWADHFLSVLSEAQKERPMRESLVDRPDGLPEIEWAAYERSVMHGEVNRIRHTHGLGPVTLAMVERLEGRAVGHSDYSLKFALYCAEMALGIEPNAR